MTIASIVRNGKGRAGKWRVTRDGSVCELWHYSTLMLRWEDTGHGAQVWYTGTGHGSVSDQGGMNTAFKVLGLPLYFSRKGGAEIN
jgi:hypothetical protein